MVQALAGDKDEVEPLTEVAKSVALSIREADSGSHALRLARESAGGAVAVTDTETVRAAELLADEGLIVDIASAASVAGAARLAADGAIDRQAPVVALLTASGARWPRPVTYTLSGRSVRGTAADVRGILC
jgi:threonine synthase